MAIANLGALKSEIALWLNRTDLTDAQLASFVVLSDSDIRNDIETRASELLATGTMTGDGFTAPTGYLSTRTLVVDGLTSDYLTPEQYAAKSAANFPTGYFTINGDDFSVLGGDGLSYELLYMASLSALEDDTDSNWVLENAPEIYLWAGCKYGSVFLKDADGALGYNKLYEAAMRKLNKRERQAKVGGSLQVRVA